MPRDTPNDPTTCDRLAQFHAAEKARSRTLWAFMARWANNLTHHPEWRLGQAAYNSLPEGHALVPTQIDPFHIDANLPAFLEWVRKETRHAA